MRSTSPRGEPSPSPAAAPGAGPGIGILVVGAAAAACIAVLAPPDPAAAQSLRAGDLPAEAWRSDLRRLERAFPERHLDAFHDMSRHGFEAGLQRLWERVGALPDHAVVVRLARVVNRVGDGHSGLRLPSDTALSFRSLPLELRVFPGGIFVVAAAPEHADLVGARLLAVNDLPAAAVFRQAADLVARDNGMDALAFAPTLMVMPEVLHALGVVEEMGSAALTVEGADGRRRTVALSPREGPFRLQGHSSLDRRAEEGGWPRLLASGGGEPPLLFRDRDRPVTVEWLPDRRAVYLRVEEMADTEEATFAESVERGLALAASRDAERFVVDLRWCRGGNGYLIRPLVLGLLKSDLDREGRLFVLVGRRTFSAGQMLVNELETLSHAVFVGEPTANRPNMYGDNEKIVLPESGLTVRAAYLRWQQRDPRDDRACTEPHVHAPFTVEAWREGRDPALEAALAWTSGGEGPGEPGPESPSEATAAGPGGVYETYLCRDGGLRTGTIF
jgi:hypothetical protein